MNIFLEYCLEKGLPANLMYNGTNSTEYIINNNILIAHSYKTYSILFHFDNSQKELILNTAKTISAQSALTVFINSYKSERYTDVNAFYTNLLIEFTNYIDIISKIKKIEIIHKFEGM